MSFVIEHHFLCRNIKANNMKTKRILLLSTLAFTLLACDKDEDEATPANNNSSNNTTQNDPSSINFSDADGTLIAVKSQSDVGIVTISIGTAVGVFYDNGTLVDVGTVSAEGIDLTKSSTNNYTASASATNPMGINYTLPINWSVDGGNGFGAFTESISRDFPSADPVNSGGTVDKSEGYTLSTNNISGADSILFTIGNVVKVIAGNNTSYTFSSAELSGLDNGSNFASIAPYNFSNKTIAGKNIYFVNEFVVQKTVSVQD